MATMQLYAEIAYLLQCAIFFFDLIEQISEADREAYIHFLTDLSMKFASHSNYAAHVVSQRKAPVTAPSAFAHCTCFSDLRDFSLNGPQTCNEWLIVRKG